MNQCKHIDENHCCDEICCCHEVTCISNIYKFTKKGKLTPFIFFTKSGEPLKALGQNKDGSHFSSPFFIINKVKHTDSCVELMVLEPVGIDGCTVEYPDDFYSLQTTYNFLVMSIDCFYGYQKLSRHLVNKPIIDPDPKKW